ncbi:hypothetical protein IQ265_04745 [Nodosilinea sp. LEGE 06152]|uniref:hypothetical protein n=1 Tax=Nodosilinea sp. LEGE 06152 TaxID=2777966 RepID=UPI0018829FD1|nr:hypothetical protein [Nodosilinea sp. LEGE 06152]MBE9156143.1 hypothetical protein [Nodosilinea sp. LEGE 06152]
MRSRCQHRIHQPDVGVYEFEAPCDWVIKVAPCDNRVSRVLKTVPPLAVPATNLYSGETTMNDWNIQQSLDAMKAATGTLLEGEFSGAELDRLKDSLLTEAERFGILALHAFLREADPHHHQLGLKRMPTYTSDYLLCETHYQAARPAIPDRIEWLF